MFEEVECFADLFPETLEDEFAELEEELLLCSAVEEAEFFDECCSDGTQHESENNNKELVSLMSLSNGKPSKPKYEVKLPAKPPQIVNVKSSPRRIQQPR
ncbi:hypothetical protein SUGI_0769470 [Cryptomeria japonica]|nr:hypothetical protein SUGI_0769470 [Cryptomeria japonica]